VGCCSLTWTLPTEASEPWKRQRAVPKATGCGAGRAWTPLILPFVWCIRHKGLRVQYTTQTGSPEARTAHAYFRSDVGDCSTVFRWVLIVSVRLRSFSSRQPSDLAEPARR